MGNCTLTAAIDEISECREYPNQITIPSGSYPLASYTVRSDIEFLGAGRDLTTIQCDAGAQIVTDDPVSINNLTITGCDHLENTSNLSLTSVAITNFSSATGAAIRNMLSGTLRIDLSLISGNITTATDSGGAIDNSGSSVAISDSEIFANSAPNGCGGAIRNISTSFVSPTQYIVDISNTSMNNNSAARGGALCNWLGRGIYVSQSSLVDNSATLDGGAIYQKGTGGPNGIFEAIDLENTTLSGNQANGNGGAIAVESYLVRLASSTVADNLADGDATGGGVGGGVHVLTGAELRMTNSIVATNWRKANTFFVASDCVGDLISDGFNLIGWGSGCTISEDNGDQVGRLSMLDPLINPLQQIGNTEVHTLQSGSPAVDGGRFTSTGCRNWTDSSLLVDQSGVDRALGFCCDIGASESGYQQGRVHVLPQSGLVTNEANLGPTEIFYLFLNGVPSAPVTVGLSVSDSTERKLGSITSVLDDKTGVLITVIGLDDAIADGDIAYQIITADAVSADPLFNGYDVPNVSATNLDDETGCVGGQVTLVPADFKSAPATLYCVASEWIQIDPNSQVVENREVNLTTPELMVPGSFRLETGSRLKVITP